MSIKRMAVTAAASCIGGEVGIGISEGAAHGLAGPTITTIMDITMDLTFIGDRAGVSIAASDAEAQKPSGHEAGVCAGVVEAC